MSIVAKGGQYGFPCQCNESDEGDQIDCPFDSQPAIDLMYLQKARGLVKFPFDNRVHSRAPLQPEQLYDVIIIDLGNKSVVEDDPGRRPGAMTFILAQSFYNRGHFDNALKEFVILNNFELEIKTDN